MRAGAAAATLAALILAGAAIFWICAHLLGAPEPSELRAVVRRKPRETGR
jgi:hypothetical protein